MNLLNALNLRDLGLAAGSFPWLTAPLLDTPEIGPRGTTAPPWYGEGIVSHLKTQHGMQYGQGASLSRAGQFGLRQNRWNKL